MKQIRVSERRRQWAKPREAVIKGEPLSPPSAAQDRYQRAMEKLIEPMRKEYEREINKLLGQLDEPLLVDEAKPVTLDANLGSAARILLNRLGKKWQARFNKVSNDIVARMIGQVSQQSKSNLGQSLKKLSGGITIPTPEVPEAMQASLSASIAENVSLIKDVPRQYRQRVESAVLVAVQSGGRDRASVLKAVVDAGEKSQTRAKLIARDQTNKIASRYNAERAKSVGMRKFQWLHSGGGAEPRRLHLNLNGQIFDYDDPPVIDERTGERGLPGQLINCRCRAIPVIDFGDTA